MQAFFVFFMVFTLWAYQGRAVECFSSPEQYPQAPQELSAFLSHLPRGSTLFLGELHGQAEVAEVQMAILQELRRQGHQLDVAMEFFSYPQQELVDAYREGRITEAEFLKMMAWGGVDFAFYRGQTLFPLKEWGEQTRAINAPRALSSALAKKGLEGLTAEERELLPPHFTLGRQEYWERFKEIMGGGHIKEEALERYFQAQSLWDDTMAWQLVRSPTTKTQVVVVGEFHVQYGGGLPDRLKIRAPHEVSQVISFVDTRGLDEGEKRNLMALHPQWGQRADLICMVLLAEGLDVN